MSAFKLDDRVLIKTTSEYYDDGNNNPKDIVGTIEYIRNGGLNSLDIIVKWDNGSKNSYNSEDLELFEENPKKRRLLVG